MSRRNGLIRILQTLVLVAVMVSFAHADDNKFVYFKKKAGGGCSAAVYSDNFNRADNAAIGGDWTSETDTGNLLDVTSNEMHHTNTATTGAYVSKTITDSNEYWVQVKIKLDTVLDVSSLGAGLVYQFLNVRSSASGQYIVGILTDAGKDAKIIRVIHKNDAGSNVNTDASFTFVAGTPHAIKLYVKGETGTSTGDGIIKLWADGTLIIDLSNVDNFTYKNINQVRLGSLYNEFNLTTLDTYFNDFMVRSDDCF